MSKASPAEIRRLNKQIRKQAIEARIAARAAGYETMPEAERTALVDALNSIYTEFDSKFECFLDEMESDLDYVIDSLIDTYGWNNVMAALESGDVEDTSIQISVSDRFDLLGLADELQPGDEVAENPRFCDIRDLKANPVAIGAGND